MPTSVLVDGEGCEIATIAGPAEWDSEDALKLITAAVNRQARFCHFESRVNERRNPEVVGARFGFALAARPGMTDETN